MNLEEKIAKLDEMSLEIDKGLSLEKSLEVFEQSVILADECMKTLNDYKGKFVILQEKVRKLTDEK